MLEMKAFVSALFFLSLSSVGHSQTIEDLADYVSVMPRGTLGTPAYWMEMKSLVGWEKMILVIGYASNQPVCEMMVRMGSEQSPDREFRCTAAN
ncbi:hypothetical protein PXK58_15680 [Phaeobacter gallaeciensis]|uniref:hypothetical protein n=1 Tax=Phaeobacter gallaeciensis TaxID=60890 RepID=UPI002380471E|nr:hypothetical protein [Phaeobacter gallaeciensis]MDE4275788.1 hypothetical protein [Phaeobacter gallaeciensis]MDE4300999.1 hypothetical protein [Phaeobacter gallaeciensis]MDE5186163.1 hypothetical protein [Phaeobacter gallaeciensis]